MFYEVRYTPPRAERYLSAVTGFESVVVFDELRPSALMRMSSPPFATLEEAVRFAEEKVPTGIVWENSGDAT